MSEFRHSDRSPTEVIAQVEQRYYQLRAATREMLAELEEARLDYKDTQPSEFDFRSEIITGMADQYELLYSRTTRALNRYIELGGDTSRLTPG
jgi:hypothetical protein